MLAAVKNFFIERRWAFAAVLIGTVVGFISAVICVRWNLVIFGFNIMFIISPLIAGFVETLIARRKHGKSTGAISAILIFLLINVYSWVFPKDPIVLNLFTLGGLALMIQAAFPILINYFIFVVFLGALTYLIGYFGNLLSKLTDKVTRKPLITEKNEEIPDLLEDLDVPIVSIPYLGDGKISKHIGMVTGETVVEERGGIGISKIVPQTKLDKIGLKNAREKAIVKMLEEAKKNGANTVIEVFVDYNSVGGLSGSATIVTATGTAVVYK